MNKNNKIMLALIVLIVIGYFVFSGDSTKPAVMTENTGAQDLVISENATVENETVIPAGTYESWSPEKIALAETKDVVLFFHASWCPSCRALNNDIEKNKITIPENVVILKVNYDTETELKKQYGVTSQHTLVQVDADGTMIKKWSGGSKLENLLKEIQ
jgi:thioredoxin 1